MTEINQKEYLKKYLGIGKGKDGAKKKKKKKVKNVIGTGLKIVDDDDLGISEANTFEEAVELLATNEDAPQIVGVIDDRPMALRIDDYRKSDKWKVIGDDNDDPQETANFQNDSSLSKQMTSNSLTKQKHNSDSDNSPPRKYRSPSPNDVRKHHGLDNSPPRKNADHKSSKRKKSRFSSRSPEVTRRHKSSSASPERRKKSPQAFNKECGSDSSPPRKRNLSPNSRNIQHGSDDFPARERNKSPVIKKEYDSDVSPPRRNRASSTPERRQKHRDSDSSPKRSKQTSNSRKHFDSSPPRRSNYSKSPVHRRKHSDSDNSPPRKNNKSLATEKNNSDSDNSPPRKNRYDSDNSPPRKTSRKSPDHNKSRERYERRNYQEHSRKRSPQPDRRWGNKDSQKRESTRDRNHQHDLDNGPPSKSTKSRFSTSPNRKSGDKYQRDDDSSAKMTKTLDGKTAGLQNAKDLHKETTLFRQREDELFKNLSAEVSGVNAATIIRDRKTGKIRDLEKEAEEKKEKQKKADIHKEKYSRWGKGLKQVQDREEKLAQDAYEMTKPLARYVDDEDLERHLREQERDGDPMLAYIRSKKKKVTVASGAPSKPQYDGEFNPNRYGIPPGHRWDGVDRSSGYEKRWFETKNAKKAQEEDNYKWSTEDM